VVPRIQQPHVLTIEHMPLTQIFRQFKGQMDGIMDIIMEGHLHHLLYIHQMSLQMDIALGCITRHQMD